VRPRDGAKLRKRDLPRGIVKKPPPGSGGAREVRKKHVRRPRLTLGALSWRVRRPEERGQTRLISPGGGKKKEFGRIYSKNGGGGR